VEEAPADEFFAAPRHPYASLLLQALPDAARKGKPLVAIGGTVPPLWQRFDGCRFAPRCAQSQPGCHQQVPELRGSGHQVRCFHPLTADTGFLPEGQALAQPISPPSPPSSAKVERPVVLHVEGLNVTFLSGGAWFRPLHRMQAVRDVGFVLHAGETLALVGESGCGKTTTGRAIMQLLRGQPQIEVSGQAWWHHAGQRQDLFSLQGAALHGARQAVQMVFQDPFASLNPRMRVHDILDEGLSILRPDWSADRRLARLLELMDQVGLRPDALPRFPHEFSGGQRQRLAIARALAVEPSVLVCDEPTSALDVSVQAQILNLLRELQQQLGLAMVFITHNMGVVSYLADQVAVMQGGTIVEQGPAEQVLGAPSQAYTQTLLAAVPRPPR